MKYVLCLIFVLLKEFYVQCAGAEGGNCQLPDHEQCTILPGVCQDNSLSHLLCPHLCAFCASAVTTGNPQPTTTLPPTTTTPVLETCVDNLGNGLSCQHLPSICTGPYAQVVCHSTCGFCQPTSGAVTSPPPTSTSALGDCVDHVTNGVTCAGLAGVCSDQYGQVFCRQYCGHCGIAGFQWSDQLPDQSTRYACLGNDLTLPWDIVTAPNEDIQDIKWFVRDDLHGDRLLAIRVGQNGQFNPLLPEYAGRLREHGTAGITLGQVLQADRGTYRVVVTSHTGSTGYMSQTHSVNVIIGEPPAVDGGVLRMQQDTTAVFNKYTGEYEVQLTCGRFAFLGEPPVSIVWNTPKAGETLTSTSMENGTFHLTLTNPLKGGDYVCQLSANAPSCLSSSSALLLTSRLTLNSTQALVTLQQAPPVNYQVLNNDMRDEIHQLENKVNNATNYVQQLTNSIQDLQTDLANKQTQCHTSP